MVDSRNPLLIYTNIRHLAALVPLAISLLPRFSGVLNQIYLHPPPPLILYYSLVALKLRAQADPLLPSSSSSSSLAEKLNLRMKERERRSSLLAILHYPTLQENHVLLASWVII